MSMDRSLKSKTSLSRHRNVLSRTERIKILAEKEKFKQDEDSPFGLPKVAHRKAPAGGKTKKKAKEGEAVAAVAATTPTTEPAKPTKPTKPTKPAKK